MECGVESICRVLPIAQSTYYAHKAVQANPERCSNRSKRDEYLIDEIKRVWVDNYSVYGVRKLWRELKREDIVVARCTVERLMHLNRLSGSGISSSTKSWFITVTGACSICRSGIRSVWQKRALSPLSEAGATPMTTHWPRRLSVSIKLN